jgi:hypothetical protein
MARRAKGKPPKREPTIYSAAATLAGTSRFLAAPKHIYVIDFDRPTLSAQQWLEAALARLKKSDPKAVHEGGGIRSYALSSDPRTYGTVEYRGRPLLIADHPTKSLLAVARRLESEMCIAFERRQCDAAWTAGAIRNAFLTWGLWPRTRLPKS